MSKSAHTPGPWEYVPSTKHHGPYVSNGWGAGDICDCYVMSKPEELSVRNGGTSEPVHHQNDEADANARLMAAAPDMLEALKGVDGFGANAAFDAVRAAIAKAEGRS